MTAPESAPVGESAAVHRTTTTGIFRVELSHPVERQGVVHNEAHRTYMRNETLQVLADTLERAVAVARDVYPDSVMHAVHRLGDRAKVLIDGISDVAVSGRTNAAGET